MKFNINIQVMSKNYIDVKYTIWQRLHYSDEADMGKLAEIVEKTGDVNDIVEEEFGFIENEVLFDTEEFITPEENKASTIEVYKDDKIIYENYKDNSLLTLQRLKDMKPGEVFAEGTIENSPEGIYMTDSRVGNNLVWYAKRGKIHDWAIYCSWEGTPKQTVLDYGEKVRDLKNIEKLVPCDDEALKMYRR